VTEKIVSWNHCFTLIRLFSKRYLLYPNPVSAWLLICCLSMFVDISLWYDFDLSNTSKHLADEVRHFGSVLFGHPSPFPFLYDSGRPFSTIILGGAKTYLPHSPVSTGRDQIDCGQQSSIFQSIWNHRLVGHKPVCDNNQSSFTQVNTASYHLLDKK
jgi:hypothetical protein